VAKLTAQTPRQESARDRMRAAKLGAAEVKKPPEDEDSPDVEPPPCETKAGIQSRVVGLALRSQHGNSPENHAALRAGCSVGTGRLAQASGLGTHGGMALPGTLHGHPQCGRRKIHAEADRA